MNEFLKILNDYLTKGFYVKYSSPFNLTLKKGNDYVVLTPMNDGSVNKYCFKGV